MFSTMKGMSFSSNIIVALITTVASALMLAFAYNNAAIQRRIRYAARWRARGIADVCASSCAALRALAVRRPLRAAAPPSKRSVALPLPRALVMLMLVCCRRHRRMPPSACRLPRMLSALSMSSMSRPCSS